MAIKDGNEAAFQTMCEEYIGFALSLAYRITGRKDDAEDIVQDSFIKIWEKKKSIRTNSSLKAWIGKIVTNKCFDLLRRRKRVKEYYSEQDQKELERVIGDDNSDSSINVDEATSVLNLLANNLSAKQRVVFTLIEMEEMTHDEVVAITGLSKNAIKSNLSHARKKLQNLIIKYEKQEV